MRRPDHRWIRPARGRTVTTAPTATFIRTLAVASSIGLVALVVPSATADPPPAAGGTTSHGFLVKRGVFSSIDHPDATTVPATPNGQAGTGVTGINNRGEMLGTYEERRSRLIRHFVLDRKGRYREIDGPRVRPPGQFDELVDINNRGEIVGFYDDDQGFTTTSFLRTKAGRYVDIRFPGSQVTGLLKINDRRQAVGIYVDDSGLHGLLWDDGRYKTVDVPGSAITFPTGINNRGQIVGSWIDSGGAYHGFLRDRHGDVTTLREAPGADPASGGTQPTAINDRGQIVGLAYNADGGSRAFRYEHGRFTMIARPGATYTRAIDINDKGEIVGDYGLLPSHPSTKRSNLRGLGFVDLAVSTPLGLG